jgi:hypothetical protein
MQTAHTRDHERAPDDVRVLRWPAEEPLRRELRDAAVPRLLVLDQSCDAPEEWDCLEDWIRSPYSAVDFEARRATIAARAARHSVAPGSR